MVEIRPRSSGEGPHYVVVRIGHDALAGAGRDHATAIETRDPDGGSTRWRSIDVIAAIRDGEHFVVEDEHGQESVLEPALCPVCPRATVTAGPTGDPPATLGRGAQR
jgi:hypothetical protein